MHCRDLGGTSAAQALRNEKRDRNEKCWLYYKIVFPSPLPWGISQILMHNKQQTVMSYEGIKSTYFGPTSSKCAVTTFLAHNARTSIIGFCPRLSPRRFLPRYRLYSVHAYYDIVARDGQLLAGTQAQCAIVVMVEVWAGGAVAGVGERVHDDWNHNPLRESERVSSYLKLAPCCPRCPREAFDCPPRVGFSWRSGATPSSSDNSAYNCAQRACFILWP